MAYKRQGARSGVNGDKTLHEGSHGGVTGARWQGCTIAGTKEKIIKKRVVKKAHKLIKCLAPTMQAWSASPITIPLTKKGEVSGESAKLQRA